VTNPFPYPVPSAVDGAVFPHNAALAIKSFTGRTVDSTGTIAVQHVGMRTVRAGDVIRVAPARGNAPARIYMRMGEMLGAYSLDAFFATTPRPPMKPVSSIPTGSRYTRRPLEVIALPNGHVYPESRSSGGWRVPLVDGQERLGDFDFDDRGFIYLAYQEFGWGIVQDKGEQGGQHFAKVVQVIGRDNPELPPTGIFPRVIIALRSGSKYFAVVSDSFSATKTAIYDVTNPAAPGAARVRSGAANGISAWAKSNDGQFLAVLNGDAKLRVYTADAYVQGTTPSPILTLAATTGKFLRAPSFDDEGNLYVLEGDARGVKRGAVLRRMIGTTEFVRFDLGEFNPKVISTANGYVAIGGDVLVNGRVTSDLLLFDAHQPLVTDGFFRKFYHAAPDGHIQPQFSTQKAVRIVGSGGRTYLMYNTHSLGDVYELQ
jgi:hypothetical protein